AGNDPRIPAVSRRAARSVASHHVGGAISCGAPRRRFQPKDITMIGITAYGGYVPRLRLSRQAVAQANAWYAPQFARVKGTRAMANWDEDSITMAVAAARDCLGAAPDRRRVRSLYLASDTLPFAERLNSGVVAGALTLDEDIEAIDLGGSQRAALSAVAQAIARV